MANKTYYVAGKITFDIEIDDIEADSPDHAEAIVKQKCLDYYNLNAQGAHHNPDKVKIEAFAGEYEEE